MPEEVETTEPTETTTEEEQETTTEPETFDLAYVQELRAENAEQRSRAKRTEELSARLLDSVIAAETRDVLADPADLRRFVDVSDLMDDDGFPSPEKTREAAERLASDKAHLAKRVPTGSVDQGARPEPEGVNLAGILRSAAG